ncbi:cytochrome P450 [Rhizodiscina lignyota]|uniref:Cytochrome P450 n=1 Tax=Rhizodiscina lignyota TaxID=1504668 RepID=A0A9P4M3M1_9PEZI|nr:cytochrome P450 [Rhizodiscina lignyota]
MASPFLQPVVTVLVAAVLSYIFYQRTQHRLARFPGPLLASITGFWRSYHEIIGDLPQTIDYLHFHHGPSVRVAPDEVDTVHPDFVDVVLKGGRRFTKSNFYDGFKENRENLFITRDEDFHAKRSRQVANTFSSATFTKMGSLFDRHASNLIGLLDRLVDENKAFDLKSVFNLYVRDVNGELFFGRNLRLQEQGDVKALTPVNTWIILAKICGYVPGLLSPLMACGPYLPIVGDLIKQRESLVEDGFKYSKAEFERLRASGAAAASEDSNTKPSLLSTLTTAKDPETGEKLTLEEVVSECMSFVAAGSHSTASSLSFLFVLMLEHPEVLKKAQEEVLRDAQTTNPDSGDTKPSRFEDLDARFPYLSATIKETFRLCPTVNNPLARDVPDDGTATIISDLQAPPGSIISATAYALHRNPAIWGDDAEVFRPERWLSEDGQQKERYLIHFGQGHRRCIGVNIAMTTLWKAAVAILQRYEVTFIGADGKAKRLGGFKLNARGFAEIAGSLRVKVKRRTKN